MAKGMFRRLDGQVMVQYGKRQGAISPARYKANGYRPVYERLEQESTHSAQGSRVIQGAKKTNPVQPSYSQCQNWLRNDSMVRISEASTNSDSRQGNSPRPRAAGCDRSLNAEEHLHRPDQNRTRDIRVDAAAQVHRS